MGRRRCRCDASRRQALGADEHVGGADEDVGEADADADRVDADVDRADALAWGLTSTDWLAGVDVESTAPQKVVVVLGDSITDGASSTVDAQKRSSDRLFTRLLADPETRLSSVVNHGLGGNRLLRDGIGPSAASRFERDVLGTPGVTHVIVLIGINDIGMTGFLGLPSR